MKDRNLTTDATVEIGPSLAGLLYAQFALTSPGPLSHISAESRDATNEAERLVSGLGDPLAAPTRAAVEPARADLNGLPEPIAEAMSPTEVEMQQLDEAQARIGELETEVAELHEQLADAQRALLAATPPPPEFPGGHRPLLAEPLPSFDPRAERPTVAPARAR